MFLTQFYAKAYALIISLIRNKEAASGIEYAIVAAMVAVILVGFMTPISTEISKIFTTIQTKLTTP